MAFNTPKTRYPIHEALNKFGDVNLSVTTANGRYSFQVSSHQLMVSSQFFAKMLDPTSGFSEGIGFKKHSTNPEMINAPFDLHVSLENMSYQAARIVLQILHGLPHGYAFCLSAGNTDLLYQIALVADYLDCGEAMKDWGTVWLKGPTSEYLKKLRDLDKVIFISDVFKSQRLFTAATKQAILRAYTMNDLGGVFWDVRDQVHEKLRGPLFTAIRPSVLSE